MRTGHPTAGRWRSSATRTGVACWSTRRARCWSRSRNGWAFAESHPTVVRWRSAIIAARERVRPTCAWRTRPERAVSWRRASRTSTGSRGRPRAMRSGGRASTPCSAMASGARARTARSASSTSRLFVSRFTTCGRTAARCSASTTCAPVSAPAATPPHARSMCPGSTDRWSRISPPTAIRSSSSSRTRPRTPTTPATCGSSTDRRPCGLGAATSAVSRQTASGW